MSDFKCPMCTDCPKNCPLDNEEDTRKYSADYYKGRADQKEEDNDFFNFEGAWKIEKQKIRAEVIEEVFRKIEERLNDNTTVTFDLPVEDVLGEDVDMDDFIMLAEKIVEEYKNLIFNKLRQAKKQLKEAENE